MPKREDGAIWRGPDSGFTSNASTSAFQSGTSSVANSSVANSSAASVSAAEEAAPNINPAGNAQIDHETVNTEDNHSLTELNDGLEEGHAKSGPRQALAGGDEQELSFEMGQSGENLAAGDGNATLQFPPSNDTIHPPLDNTAMHPPAGDAGMHPPPSIAGMPTVGNGAGDALRCGEPGAPNLLEFLIRAFPVNMAYRDCATRMRSFSQPTSGDLDGEIANAGFFEPSDNSHLLRCFFCDVAIERTKLRQPSPDPWIVHAKISSTCSYLIATKGSTFVDSVRAELTEEEAAYLAPDSARCVRPEILEFVELIKKTCRSTLECNSGSDNQPPDVALRNSESEQRLSSLEQNANSREQRLSAVEQNANGREQRLSAVEQNANDEKERTKSRYTETSKCIAIVKATANQNKDAISVMGNTVDAEREARILTDGRVDVLEECQQLTNVTTQELAQEIAINSNELETQRQENRVNRRTDRMALGQEERTRASDIEGLRASIPGAVEEHFQEVVAENLQEDINNIERSVQSVASDVQRVEGNLRRVGDQSHTTAVTLDLIIEDQRDPDIRRADTSHDGGDEPV